MKWKLKELCTYAWRFMAEDRGFDLPVLHYAWLIHLINKQKDQPPGRSSVHIT
jgi:hypothetical protein